MAKSQPQALVFLGDLEQTGFQRLVEKERAGCKWILVDPLTSGKLSEEFLPYFPMSSMDHQGWHPPQDPDLIPVDALSLFLKWKLLVFVS